MKSTKRAFFMLFFIFALSGFGVADDGSWRFWRNSHSLDGSTSNTALADLSFLWRFGIKTEASGTPVSDGTSIFFLLRDGDALALGLDGTQKWHSNINKSEQSGVTNDIFEAPFSLVEKLLLVGSLEGNVFGVNKDDGKFVWRYETENSVRGAIVANSSNAFVLTREEGIVHALKISDGSKLWVSAPITRSDGHPTLFDGHIYFGSCDSAVHKICTADGRIAGKAALGGGNEIAGALAAANGKLFVNTRAGTLVCIDADSMKVLWKAELKLGDAFPAPAIIGQSVITVSDSGKIYCIDVSDGAERWSADGGFDLTSPVIAGNTVLAVGDGKLKSWNLLNGKEMFSLESGDTSYPPAIVKGIVVLALDSKNIAAFGKNK